MKLRQLIMELFDMDPFLSCCTIASVCMAIYRSRFLPEDTIGIVPSGGYRKADRQSIIAIIWLQWISELEDISIQHARNGGEVNISRYKVDGQDRANKQQVN